MHNSVVCAEDAPFFGETTAPIDAYLGTMIVDALSAICELWPVGVRDEDFKAPVVSDRPVLVLSGENDPVTPPAYGERVIAGGLGNAVHLIGPGQGHGIASVGCVPRIMRDFLATPEPGSVSAQCLEREPPMPFFLTFEGPAP
jgi:pimeloyl-ACP methyl ester carboxylesterase